MLFQSHKLFAFQLSQIECAQLLTVVSTNHSFAHTSVTAQLLWTLLNSFHFVGLDSSLLIVLETDLFNFNSLFLIYLFFSTSWENLSTNWFGCVTSHLFILFNVAEWPNPVNFRALILLRLSCLCSFQVNWWWDQAVPGLVQAPSPGSMEGWRLCLFCYRHTWACPGDSKVVHVPQTTA